MKLLWLDQKQGNLTTRDLNSQFSCRSHGQLESAADASLCTYKLIQDLLPIIILFWGLRYSTRMVKKHRIRMRNFVKSKNPREQRTIPYSTAFTSSWTSPRQNYIIKQGIMHSCPKYCWGEQVLRYRITRLGNCFTHPRNKKQTGKQIEPRTVWVVGLHCIWPALEYREREWGLPWPWETLTGTTECLQEQEKHQWLSFCTCRIQQTVWYLTYGDCFPSWSAAANYCTSFFLKCIIL